MTIPKFVVDFLLENTSRKQIHGNGRGFRRKKVTATTANQEIVDDFACEAKNLRNLWRFRIF